MSAPLPGSLDVGYLFEIPNTLEKRSHEPTPVDVTTNFLALPSYPEKALQSISRGYFHGDTSYLANVSLDLPPVPTAAPLLASTGDDSDDELLARVVPVGVAVTVLRELTREEMVNRDNNDNDNDHDHNSSSADLTTPCDKQQPQRPIPATEASNASTDLDYTRVPTTPLNTSSTPITTTTTATATTVTPATVATASLSPAPSSTSVTQTSAATCAATSTGKHEECATASLATGPTLSFSSSSPSFASASTSVSGSSPAPLPPSPTAHARADAAFLLEVDTRLAALTATSFSALPRLPHAPDVCDAGASTGANPDEALGLRTDTRTRVRTEAVATVCVETTDTHTPVPSSAYLPVPPAACAERVYLQQLRRALRVARALPRAPRKPRTSTESAVVSRASPEGCAEPGASAPSGRNTGMGTAAEAGTGTDVDAVGGTSGTNTGMGAGMGGAPTDTSSAPTTATTAPLLTQTHAQTQTRTCAQTCTPAGTRARTRTRPREYVVLPPRVPVPAPPFPPLLSLPASPPPPPASLHCSFVLLPFSENMFAPLLTSCEPVLPLSDALISPLALLPLALSLDALLRASGPIDYILPLPCTTTSSTAGLNISHAATQPLITSTRAAAPSMDVSEAIPCTALAPSLCLAALAAAATMASGASAPQVLDFTLARTPTLAHAPSHVDMGTHTGKGTHATRANDTPDIDAASIAAQTRTVKLPLPRGHPYLSAARMHARAHRHASQGHDPETESSGTTHSFSPLHVHHTPPPPPLTPTHVSLPLAPILLPHPVRHGMRHALSSLLALREPEQDGDGAGRPLLASARVLVIGSVENTGAVLQALLSLNTHTTHFTVRTHDNASNATTTHARVVEPVRVITSAATDTATASVGSPALVLRDATPLPFDAVAPAIMAAAAVVRVLRLRQQQHARATKVEGNGSDGGGGSGRSVERALATSSSSLTPVPVPVPSATVLFPFADACLTWLQATRFPFSALGPTPADSRETPAHAHARTLAHAGRGVSSMHARVQDSLPPAPAGLDVSLPAHARALMHAIVATHVYRTAAALRAMRAVAQGDRPEDTTPTQGSVSNNTAQAPRGPAPVGGGSVARDNHAASTARSSATMSNASASVGHGSVDARNGSNDSTTVVGSGPRPVAASGQMPAVGDLARLSSSHSLPILPSAADLTVAASAIIPEWFPHPLRTTAAPSLPPLSLTELSLLYQPLPAAHRYRQAAATAGEVVRVSARQMSAHGSAGVVVASTGSNAAGTGSGVNTGNGDGAETGTGTYTDNDVSTQSDTGSGSGTSDGVEAHAGAGAGPSTVGKETGPLSRTLATQPMSVGAAVETSAAPDGAITTTGTGTGVDAGTGTGTGTGVEHGRVCVCWGRGCAHCAGRGCSTRALSDARVSPSGAFGAVWAMRGDVDDDVAGDVTGDVDLKFKKNEDKGTTMNRPPIEAVSSVDGCVRSAEVVVWSEGDWWGEAAGALCHEVWRAGCVKGIECTQTGKGCEVQGKVRDVQAAVRGPQAEAEAEEDKGLGLLCGGSWLCWPTRTLLTQVHGNVLATGTSHGVRDGIHDTDAGDSGGGGGGDGLGIEGEGVGPASGPSTGLGTGAGAGAGVGTADEDDVAPASSRERETRVGASTTTVGNASGLTNAGAQVSARGHRHAPVHTHGQGAGRTRWAAAAQSSHALTAHGSSSKGISQPSVPRGGSRGANTASKQPEGTRMGVVVGSAKASLPTHVSTTTTASRLLRVTLLPVVLDPSRTGRGYTAASRDRLHAAAERLSLCTDMRVAVGGRALYMLPDQPATDTFAYLTRVLGWAVRGRVVQPAESGVAPSLSSLLPMLLCGATEAEVLILCRAQDVFDVVEGVLRPEQREAAVQMLDRVGALELRCAVERSFSRRYTRSINASDGSIGAPIEDGEGMAEDEEGGAGWGYRLSSAALGSGGEDVDHGVFADARVPVSSDSGVSLACAPILYYHHERPLVVAMPPHTRTRTHTRVDVADDIGSDVDASIMPSALYTPLASHHLFLDPRVHPRAHTLHTGHVLAQSGSSGAELHAPFMHANARARACGRGTRATAACTSSTFSKWLWHQLAQRPFAPAHAHAVAVSFSADTRTHTHIGCSRQSTVGTPSRRRANVRDEPLAATAAQSLLAGLHPVLGYALTHATHTTSAVDAPLARVRGPTIRPDSLLGAAQRYARGDGTALAHATVHGHGYYADDGPDGGAVDMGALAMRLSSISPRPPALVPPMPALQPAHLPQPLSTATSASGARRALALAHPADPALPATFMHAAVRRATQKRVYAADASDSDADAEHSDGDEVHAPRKPPGPPPALPPLRSLLSVSPSERAALSALQAAFLRTRATTGPSLALLARDRAQGDRATHQSLPAPLAILARTLDTWAPVASLLSLPSAHTLAPHPLLNARGLVVQMPPQSSSPTPSLTEALPAVSKSPAAPSHTDVAPGSHQAAFNAFAHHRDLLRQYHAGLNGDTDGSDVYTSRRGSMARARGPVRYGEELEGGGAGGAAEWVSDEDDSSTASMRRGSVSSDDEAERDAPPPSLLPVRSTSALSTMSGLSAGATPRLALRQLQGVDATAMPSTTSPSAYRSPAAITSNSSSSSAPPLLFSRAGAATDIHAHGGLSRPTSALPRLDRDLSVSVNDSFSLLTAQPLSRISTPQQQTRGGRPAGSAASVSTTGTGSRPQTRGGAGEGTAYGRTGTGTSAGSGSSSGTAVGGRFTSTGDPQTTKQLGRRKI